MARTRRIKKDSDAHYHLMSRTNDRRFLFESGEAEVDFESIGAEITQENRYGACFVRMAMPDTPDGKREFASWGGMHPKASTVFNPIFISLDKAE